MDTARRARQRGTFLMLGAALLAGCNGGGGGGGSAIVTSSLAGTILGPDARGLEGVHVVVSGATTKQVTTDANGNFILLEPPTGLVRLRVDGSGVASGTYPTLELPLIVGAGAINLPLPVVLPDLDAGATLDVPVDVGGVTIGASVIGDALVDGFSLELADMTALTVDGAPPSGGTIALNVTPVAALDVPVPLPALKPGALATIQPTGVAFGSPPTLTLPNTGGFRLGTQVSLWHLDPETGAWVNRSQETGHRGTVVELGGRELIVADGLVAAGGWYAATVPVDPACATTLTGQFLELHTTRPLPDALITLSTGQFARTDAAGRFRIDAVPAYDANCQARTLFLRALAPVAYEASVADLVIPAARIATGGTTALEPFGVTVGASGSLVGAVRGGRPVEGTVTLVGPEQRTLSTDAAGNFFAVGLVSGPYAAGFEFDDGIVFGNVTIVPHQTAFVGLAPRPPTGPATLAVQVLSALDRKHPTPIAGAFVTLVGASGAPQYVVADAGGIADFPHAPPGPYTITAQVDSTSGSTRSASTLVGVLPTSDPGTILLPFLNVGAGSGTVNLDATLIGAVLNAPVNHILEYQVATASRFPLAGDASVEFTENIPSNEPFDVAVVARDPSDGRTTSAVFVHDVTAVSGEVLHLDFDFAQAVPFDRTVTVTYPNAPDGGSRAQLELFGAGEIVLARDDSPLPREQVLAWPDLSGPALVGFAPTFEVLANGFDTTFHNSTCVLPLEHVTPSALTVKLLGPPAIQSPVNQALFASYGPGARVAFTLGTGAGTPVGFNDVVFVGHAGAVGVFTFWEILMAPTQTRVTLPPVFPTKPMFDWGTHQVSVETARFDFPGFAFATFFDQDLPNRLAAIDAGPLCSARRLHTFGIDPTQRLVVPPELPHAPHVWRR